MSKTEPKKSLGQHWLQDARALQLIAMAAQLTAKDTVLEIGPGQGSLTAFLLQQAGSVVTVELDERLAENLEHRLAGQLPDPALWRNKLSIVAQDILKFDLTSLTADYKVVANVPYYITGKIVRLLCESPNRPSLAVLLIQKEVAERICAQPGDLSIVALTTQFYFEPSLGPVLPPKLFTPPPKVDSQVLVLKRRKTPLYPDVVPDDFFRLIKAGFSAKRKTLLNALAGGLRLDKDTVAVYLMAAAIEPTLRAQALTPDQWHALHKVLQRDNVI